MTLGDSPLLSNGSAGFTPGISERRSSATKYLHEDFLGSTTRLTDASQATTDTRQYDAFGNVVSSSGSNPLPFAFAGGWGYQSDADSGLMLLGHRCYDSSTGRFITRDAETDGRNWYIYGNSDPGSFVDPSGTTPWGLLAGNEIARQKRRRPPSEVALPGRDKGRGDDPYYDETQFPDDELKRILDDPNTPKDVKQRVRRVQKHRLTRRSRERKNNFEGGGIGRAPVISLGPRRSDPSPVNGWAVTAVALYWIISEGSRILFPPRNLIPVP